MLTFNPPLIAHRGASGLAPENTLAAFIKAKELGINWVEFDVMLTSCGEVVVIHDETVDRTTNGKGLVVEQTYASLKKLDAGSWFNPIFFKERIPTLKQVLELLNKLQLSANIEIKAQLGMEKETVARVLQNLEQTKLHYPFLISSFSLTILENVRKQSSSCLLGFLMDKWLPDWLSLCDQLNCATVNVNERILDHDKVQQIKKSGRFVLAYTVNDAERAKELFSWGVDAVFADRL